MEKDRLVTIFKNDKILIDVLKRKFLIKDKKDYSEASHEIIETENEIKLYALADVLLFEEEHINSSTITNLLSELFLKEEIKMVFNTFSGVNEEVLSQIYFSFKYSNVKNFFFDNYTRFLPEFDILKIHGKEKVKIFQESLMREFDKFSTIIDDISILQDIDEIPTEYIKYLAQLVGFEREEILYITDERFRVFVKNIIEIYKVKGTNYSFELFLNFLGYNVEIFEYWFDRRYANYSSGFNPFTGETNKESFTFYLTPNNPTEVVPANIFPKEFAKIEDISAQMNVWDFNTLAQQFEPNILLGYKKNYMETKYTGNYFKFFKTNVVEFRLSVLSYSNVVTGEQELLALRKYIDFLLPINLIKIITITSVTPDENAGWQIVNGILTRALELGVKETRFDKFYSSDEIGNLKSLYLDAPTFSDLDYIGLIGKSLPVKKINNQGQYPEESVDKLFLYGKKQEIQIVAKLTGYVDDPTFVDADDTGAEGYFIIIREASETEEAIANFVLTKPPISSGNITVAKTTVAVLAGDTLEDVIEKIDAAITMDPLSEWSSTILTSRGGTILVCDLEIEIPRGESINSISSIIASQINSLSANWSVINSTAGGDITELTFTRINQNEISFQYSPDGVNWYNEFIPGNCYIRFSVNSGVTWESKNEYPINTNDNILENIIFYTSFTSGVFKSPQALFDASTKPDFNWNGKYLVIEQNKWYQWNTNTSVWEEYLPINEESVTTAVYDTLADLIAAETTTNFNWAGKYYITTENKWYKHNGFNWMESSPFVKGNLEEKLFNAFYILPRDAENELDNLGAIYHLSKKNGRLHKHSSSRKIKNEASLQEHQIEKLVYRNISNNSEVWIQKPTSSFNPIRGAGNVNKVEIRHAIDLLNDGIYNIISTRTESVDGIDYFITEINPIPYKSLSTIILLQNKLYESVTDPTFVDTDNTGLDAFIQVVQEGSSVPPYEKELAKFVIYNTAVNSGNIEIAGVVVSILNTDTIEEIIEKIKIQLIANNSDWVLKERARGTFSFVTDVGYPIYSISKYVTYGTNTFSEIKIRNPYSYTRPDFVPEALSGSEFGASKAILRYTEDRRLCNDCVKNYILTLRAKDFGDKTIPTMDFGSTGISYSVEIINEGTGTIKEIINIFFLKKASVSGTITIDGIETPIYYTDSLTQIIDKIIAKFEELGTSNWEALRKENMSYEIKSYRRENEYLYIATEPLLNLQNDIPHVGSTVRGLVFIDRDDWNLHKQYRTLFNDEDFFWYYS